MGAHLRQLVSCHLITAITRYKKLFLHDDCRNKTA